VHALDEFFHRKYEEVDSDTEGTRLVKVKSAEEIVAEEEANADAHPPAVAVVLADRVGLRLPDHRLRRDLQPAAHRGGRGIVSSASSDGCSSRRSPTTVTTTRRPTAAVRARSWRQLADIAVHESEPASRRSWPRPRRRSRWRHATSTGLSNNKLAMWLFLGSECLLFGGLISTYMLYRGRRGDDPGPAQVFDIPLTSVSASSC
jgi:hypothetical protein